MATFDKYTQTATRLKSLELKIDHQNIPEYNISGELTGYSTPQSAMVAGVFESNLGEGFDIMIRKDLAPLLTTQEQTGILALLDRIVGLTDDVIGD